MNNYLSEAFKKLDILDEDVFELDKDGLTALKDFEDSDEDDTITVVDPDAESEEDLEDSYIGKVILDCSVCHTDIYKDKEDITIDEESGLANIGEECPYCYSSDGFKVIGEVKPFVETTFETEDDVNVEVDGEEVEKNESLRRNRRLKESKKLNESPDGWEFIKYDGVGPVESDAYYKYVGNDIQLVIYPPQTVAGNTYDTWEAEIYTDNGSSYQSIDDTRDGFDSFEEAEAWINSKIKNLGESLRRNRTKKFINEDYNLMIGDLVPGNKAVLMKPFYLGKTGEVADAGSIVEVSNLTRRSSIPGGYHYKFFDKNGNLFYEDDLWLYNYDLDKNEDDSWINPDLIKVKLIESLKESCSINQCQKWVDYDMKKYKKISDDTMKKIKSSGYSVVKDQYGDYEVIANRKDESCGKRKSKNMKESIEDITIDTGDQEITVSAKDKEEIESDGEMIAPLSDEVKADIETGSDDTIDVDVDDFSEEDFDELGESYLKKVYENVDSYRTISAKTKGNKLYLEGLIKFNSGKEKKTSFVFESRTITKTGKAKLIGENLQISRGHKSFKLTGTINNGKFISESLNYNYRVKNGNESQRVYGTAKKSK